MAEAGDRQAPAVLFAVAVLKTRAEDPEHGLILNFLADNPAAGHKVTTGHDSGVITVALTGRKVSSASAGA